MALNDDLARLDHAIRQLQIEWDKFFSGVERRPPSAMQAQVEALVRQYANAEIRNATERFRYQSLATRFATFNELWTKRLRALEEGRPLGMHGLRAQNLPLPPPPPPPAETTPAARAAAASAAGSAHGEYRVGDAGRDNASVSALYERFAAARAQTGEPAVKFDTFRKLISQQADRLRSERGASAVDFRIETKDGKVSLKAKPVK